MLGFEFPPINSLLRWQDFFPSFNKVAAIAVAAMLIGTIVYLLAGRKDPMVAPTGVRNLAETSVEFVENGIVMETMGKDGLGWTPFLLSIFVFVYLCNVTGIIPIIYMPATARIAIPMFLSLLVWVVFIGTGFKHQGFFGYWKSTLFPPGVPKALYILVTPIELLSTFIVRPFSLAVRIFANELAGHLLLVTFSVLTATLFARSVLIVIMPVSFAMLVAMTLFEVLVVFLQAFIFTILTAVYIGGAMHPEH